MIAHPVGTSGLMFGSLVFCATWMIVRGVIVRGPGPYDLDPKGVQGAFEPLLAKYLRFGEFVVGLASGSIVLLIGSAALRHDGSLPTFYASPLRLLGWCVLYGVIFMAWLIYHYEDYQHGAKHTRGAYALSLTLGFSSLVCFVCGYVWLILTAS
jgi:hypothetical protein